jgi:outer membrane receptor for ferrienterochelin and colicin
MVQAGVTGKISGKITDKVSGFALPGVNIYLSGTSLGAATDLEGEFYIIQIPPGIYEVKISMIGYKDVTIKNVEVLIDHTTPLYSELEEEVYEGEEVVIIAERPVIQKDLTSSTQFLTISQIQRLPITQTKDAVWLQTGVFFDPLPATGGLGGHYQGEQRYSIRGGSQDEVMWFLDGVRTATLNEAQADQAGSFSTFNINAIQEIQVVTGGFTAEYGEAQSGIVNVITKEGGENISASVEYIYSPPGQRHFGNYIYDPNTQKEFLDHTLEDGSLDPVWWTPHRQNQLYDYRTIPDHVLYFSLGGPIFNIGHTRGTFYLSTQLRSEAYTLPHPRDTKDLNNFMGTVTLFPSPNTKLKLNGVYNKQIHSTLQRAGDFTNQAKYYRGWGSLLDQTNTVLSANWNHTLQQNMFYDLKLSYYSWDLVETPSPYTVLGKSVNPTLFGYQRYDNFGFEPFDAYSFIYDQHKQASDISMVGSLNWQWNNENFIKSGFEIRYNTYQENYARQYPSFTLNPEYFSRRGLHETYHPIQFAAYLQNKLELEGMILNLGVRFDYFDPNYDWFSGTHHIYNLSANPDYDQAFDLDGDQIDENGNVKYSFDNILDKERKPASPISYISPRLGISFPLTDYSLLHFNYGHFMQMPPVNRMYEFTYWRPVYITEGIIAEKESAEEEGREPRHIPSASGDPERVIILSTAPLRPEKTVMFETGIKLHFDNFAFLGVTAYYKDVYDQTSNRLHGFDRLVYAYDPFIDRTTPNVPFISNFPGDYGSSRGFEVTFRTLFSQNLILDMNYNLSSSTEGRSTPGQIVYDENGQPTYSYEVETSNRSESLKTYSRPHILRANLFLRYPEKWKVPVIYTLFRNTVASVLYRYISGQAFTYLRPEDPPDTIDNFRYPATQNVDLRLDKSFIIDEIHNLTFYIRITNLLNAKNLRSFGGDVLGDQSDPSAIKNYVENGEITSKDVDGYDISWMNYYDRRKFYFGVRYNFN